MKTGFRSKIGSLLIITAAVAFWLGCATIDKVEEAEKKSLEQISILQEQSAGKVPCRSNEIEISEFNINEADGSGYWTVFCSGNTYKCVKKDNQDVHCEPTDRPEI